MSDSVTNTEIEDVLSSIRRLVSENAASQPSVQSTELKSESEQSEAPSDEDETPADKLVLTPDIRVQGNSRSSDEEAVAEVQTEVEYRMEGRSEMPADAVAPPSHEEVNFEQGGNGETDFAPGLSENISDTPDIEEPAEPKADETNAMPEAAPVEVEKPQDAAPVPEPAEVESEPLEDRVAELEAALNGSSAEFEPDVDETVEDLGPTVFSRRRAEQVPEIETNWDAVDADVSDFVDAERAIDAVADLEAPEDDHETDDSEDDDTFLDADMLRELVGRLVREELRGAVGEKITQNVRRLVRREVERAITLKGLE